jgi:hypothetical protein
MDAVSTTVGPAPIPRLRLTPGRLSDAVGRYLCDACSGIAYAKSATAFRRENSLYRAVAAITASKPKRSRTASRRPGTKEGKEEVM